MNRFKKLITIFLAVATLSNTAIPLEQEGQLHAADYVYDAGGCGYQQCRKAPCIAPAIALGTIALVAIIAVAIQNQGDSGHGHCGCSNSSSDSSS